MPTDKSGEFGNVFRPALEAKLKRKGLYYEFEEDWGLFDNEYAEDSENEDTWDNQAQRLRYNCKAKFQCRPCNNNWTSYYAQMTVLIRVEQDYDEEKIRYCAKMYD